MDDIKAGMYRLLKHLREHEARMLHLEERIESLSDQLDSGLQELQGTQGALDDRQRALLREQLDDRQRTLLREQLIREARMS